MARPNRRYAMVLRPPLGSGLDVAFREEQAAFAALDRIAAARELARLAERIRVGDVRRLEAL